MYVCVWVFIAKFTYSYKFFLCVYVTLAETDKKDISYSKI